MKKILLIVYCGLTFCIGLGQESKSDTVKEKTLDSLYREDQFYIGITYNLILNRPTDVSQSGFSGGLHFGFVRDMPINKRRNVAFGLGLGYSVNVYNNNLLVGEEGDAGPTVFGNLRGVDFKTNRFTTHLFEAPIEFRWRTSEPDSHKFYRIYTGLRLGYLYYFKSNFKGIDSDITRTKIDELNRLRFGATFTFGWNTFNFHFYYSLNSLFDSDAVIGTEKVGINTAKVGLVFYLL
ncbi:porin family protein [Aquimarina sp. AU474]|uniref:porin family protein n=1 Tax=Aquimarina sp. AU474 TaxID=2108529 RepID=UPI000D697401|nr:porin family protein [Aquimarina sp. AU474]